MSEMEQNFRTLLATDADVTGATFGFGVSRQQALLQVSITGTQTVTVEGRLSDDHDWFTILTTAVDTAVMCLIMPQMRAVTSGTSGGSSVTSVVF